VQFDSYFHLRAYTLANHQFFPLDAAKANGLTTVLLKDFKEMRGGRQPEGELSELIGQLAL